MKAITVGSATIDIIATIANTDIEQMSLTNQTTSFLLMEPGRKVDAEAIVTHTGGGAINTAISLKRLGFEVSPLVKVGKDLNAAKLLERFDEVGLGKDLVRKHGEQATAVSLLIASHDRNAAIFTHRGANGFMTDEDMPPAIFDDAAIVYVTNMSNASADQFPNVVSRGKASGAFVAVNPGIRQLTTRTEPFFDSLQHVDLFICNRHEASTLIPKLVERTGWEKEMTCPPDEPNCLTIEGFRLSFKDYATRIHRLGPRYVGITDGGDGAYLFVDGKFYFQPVMPTEVAGTTGAGDSFASTLSGCLVKAYDPAKALRLAAINASSVVSFVDAQSGLLSFDDLLKIEAEI